MPYYPGWLRRQRYMLWSEADVIIEREGNVAIAVNTKTREIIAMSTDHDAVLDDVLTQLDEGIIFLKSILDLYSLHTLAKPISLVGRKGGSHVTADKDISGIRCHTTGECLRVDLGAHGIVIRDLSIIAGDEAKASATAVGLRLTGVHGVKIVNVKVKDFAKGIGILISPSSTDPTSYASFNMLEHVFLYNNNVGIKLTTENTPPYFPSATRLFNVAVYGDKSLWDAGTPQSIGIDIDSADYTLLDGVLVSDYDVAYRVAYDKNNFANIDAESSNTGLKIETNGEVLIGRYNFDNVATPIDKGTYTPTINAIKSLGTRLGETYNKTYLRIKSNWFEWHSEDGTTVLGGLGKDTVAGILRGNKQHIGRNRNTAILIVP